MGHFSNQTRCIMVLLYAAFSTNEILQWVELNPTIYDLHVYFYYITPETDLKDTTYKLCVLRRLPFNENVPE